MILMFSVVAMLLANVTPARSDTIYSMVNYLDIYNGCTMSGYITTNGHTGALTDVDIVDWQITVSPPVGYDPTIWVPAIETPSNSSDEGSVFEATAQYLTAAYTGDYLYFGNNTDGSGIQWDIDGNNTAGELPDNIVSHAIFWWNPWPQPPETGIGVIAQVVPEPGTLTLLGLAGLSGLAMVWIRRRRLSG
jgi:hypothetical protein